MCCCCPPAINALFCLWLQSGCSKGSVAGALTFFPPDPPLYKFERYNASGRLLEDDDDADEEAQQPPAAQEGADTADPDNEDAYDMRGDDEERMEIIGPTGHVEPLEDKSRGSSNRRDAKQKSPAQQLVERSRELRKRAKKRNARDAMDATNGVTYRVALDPRLTRPPSGGTVEAVKIRKPSNVHVAALIYRVPANRSSARTKTIIYSHGNATDVGAMFSLQSILVQALECNVVSFDYSGYGESGGVAQENATYSDIKAVYKYCAEHVSTNPANIILYGQSVGSGPVCHLGYKNNDIGGIILHSPFTSGMRVLTPSRLLACLDIYPNINRIKHVRCPVMVIHGKLDEEVGYRHGVEMYEAVPDEYKRDPWWVPDRGHNDITEGTGKMAEYIRRLRRFLEELDDE
mmetsp:Transcript_5850/g.9716  ORF Transcript_5850/g.9716 Transcript_5850/m.9716 type:complete len:404 (+) Transcript_5850:31-1242(+)